MAQPCKGRMKRKKRLTADELLFQPWFLSAEIAQAIRVLIPPGYQRKMRDYFDSYGCMKCDRRDGVYQSNGMCKLCVNVVRIRLRKCIQQRLSGTGEIASPGVFVGAPQKASRLLRGISRGSREKHLPRGRSGPANPALDAFNRLGNRQPSIRADEL
jgi:hypothetical protein